MALTLAILISLFGGKYKPKILKPVEIAQNFFFKILVFIMWFSPIASFSAMAFLIGKFGIGSLVQIASLLGVMLISVLAFIFIILGIITAMFKINIFKFMRYIQKEVLIVFATSSSESALAPLMKRLEAAGVNKSVTGLILPTGYSFNLDCTNIYLALSIIFLSQAFNIPLTLEQQLFIIGLLDEVEALCGNDRLMKIWFDESLDFQRNNETLIASASKLGIDELGLDTFFIEASKL